MKGSGMKTDSLTDAAPDLLKACKEARYYMKQYRDQAVGLNTIGRLMIDEKIAVISEAIEKAEGVTP